MMRKRRVLLIAESVTLAHIVRLRQLGAALDRKRYEVWFASCAFPELVFEGTDFKRVVIQSMSGERLQQRIERGQALYDKTTLAGYVSEELALLERIAPDLVIGDMRLSLCVSAAKLGIRYAVLTNAYLSPHAVRDSFPIPEHPLVSLLGLAFVSRHFHKGLPFVLDHFAAPVNSLRKRYGLPVIGNLFEVLTCADYVLYPDVPELAPTRGLPAHHHYLGPVLWAPELELPDCVARLDSSADMVYVTLGSSGTLRVLDAVIGALAELPVQVLLATAGRYHRDDLPPNVHACAFAPGDLAARRARVVVCSGGSTTAYQALYEGTAVLGLPQHLDQYLAMRVVEGAHAGRVVRSGRADRRSVRDGIAALLHDDAYSAGAGHASRALRALDSAARFCALVDSATGSRAEIQHTPQQAAIHMNASTKNR